MTDRASGKSATRVRVSGVGAYRSGYTPVHQSLELEAFRERRKLGPPSDHKRQLVASAMEPSIPRYRKAAP